MPLLTYEPRFAVEGSPYIRVLWSIRDVCVKKADGSIVFQQKGIEAPVAWSEQAVAVVAQKYLRGFVDRDGNPGPNRERSIRQLIDRVVDTIAGWAGYKLQEGEPVPEGWTRTKVVESSLAPYLLALEDNEEIPQGYTKLRRVTHKRPHDTMQPAYEVYFENRTSWEAWKNDLKWLCVNQHFSFNSPVWFNVGVDEHPQCSACFIVRLEDWLQNEGDLPFDVDSHGLLAAQVKEGIIFSNGSGSGLNLSRIRSSKEYLSGGGHATGPLSFARGLDTWASQIKSGGKSRRAAKMLVMDVDHPDVHEFITAKAKEEKIAKILEANGYGKDMDSESYQHAFHQNSNLSVRTGDLFMRAVDAREEHCLVARSKHHLKGTTIGKRMIGGEGLVIETLNAYDMMKEIAQSCWESGDPGMQFADTINHWHTCAEDDLINASNPCSEYLFLDETACNLGSFNLLKFGVGVEGFEVVRFTDANRAVAIAMEVIVPNSRYPTKNFARMSDQYRTLGVGYSNLGGLLMVSGLPYDSVKGRALASAITSLMTATVYETSASIAEAIGPFARFKSNQVSFVRVMKQHLDHDLEMVQGSGLTKENPAWVASSLAWRKVVQACEFGAGVRNAQATVLAPTGTISLMMDCDAMGIEPELAHVKYKSLAGGGTLKMTNQLVAQCLQGFRISAKDIDGVKEHLLNGMSFRTYRFEPEVQPQVISAMNEVMKTSFPPDKEDPDYAISWNAHIEMMAAAQPFLSGGISKTVNMPNQSTVEDIMGAYNLAWHRGLKCVAIYRDGSKMAQPLSTKQGADGSKVVEAVTSLAGKPGGPETAIEMLERAGLRRKPASHVPTLRCKFDVDGYRGYLHVGFFKDNWDVAEIFVKMAKMGSSIAGFVDGFCRLFSVAIQYGVPMEELIEGFRHTDFEPHGFIQGDPHVRSCRSIPDYIVQKIEALQKEAHEIKGLPGDGPSTVPAYPGPEAPLERLEKAKESPRSGKSCNRCGSFDVRILGKCNICLYCGNEEGGCFA